jgi:hypothetical protein
LTSANFVKPSPIVKLDATHKVDAFNCNYEALNDFLKKRALSNQNMGSTTTYVTCRDLNVVGYYSITIGGVTHDRVAPRIKNGMPKYDIPVVILARLGVHIDEQGNGIGTGLLKDALLRTVQIANIAGVRALLVDAKPEAKEWYLKYDFEQSPLDENQLFLLMKDLKNIIS